MDYQLKRLDHVPVYEGKVFTAFQDTMELPGGRREKWDFIEHRSSGAAVVAVLPDGKVLLVRQFRPAIGRETLELPAGARERTANGDFEDSKVTACRELREETGYLPLCLTKLIRVHSSPAYNTECTDVYLADSLKKEGELLPDEAEEISVEAFSREELERLLYSGQITDSKTVAGLLAWMHLADLQART